jgi:hypothetical protein
VTRTLFLNLIFFPFILFYFIFLLACLLACLLAQVMQWYREEFGQTSSRLLAFVHKYLPPAEKKILEDMAETAAANSFGARNIKVSGGNEYGGVI